MKKIVPDFIGSAINEKNEALFVLGSASVVFFLLLIRNFGLYSSMSDERSYLLFSQIWSLSESPVPSYLHLWLYKQTQICGPSFLECARVLNGLFFAGAVPVIYLICRRGANRPISLLVAFISAAGPTSFFSAFYMPEPMYFFCFWLAVLIGITASKYEMKPYSQGAVVGLLIAILSLIKAHGIFILLGTAFFLFLIFCTRRSRLIDQLIILSMMIGVFLLIRIYTSYFFTGTLTLNLMGKSYSSLAERGIDQKKLISLTVSSLKVLANHSAVLLSLFTLPIAIILTTLFSKKGSDLKLWLINLFFISITFSLLIIVAYFTASVAGLSPYETLTRLHVRYYSFIFPFFAIATGWHLSDQNYALKTGSRKVAIPMLLLTLLAISIAGHLDSQLLADAPEFLGIVGSYSFKRFAFINLIILVLWIFKRKIATLAFLLIVLPCMAVVATTASIKVLKHNAKLDVYNEAGIFTSTYLYGKTSSVAIVTSEAPGAYRTMFYLRNYLPVIELPQGSTVESHLVPKGHDWVLLLGNYKLSPDFKVNHEVHRGSYALFHIGNNLSARFREEFWPGIIHSIEGFGFPENFGRWTVSESAVIHLQNDLPNKFDLRLKAFALVEPGKEKDVEIIIGDETKTILLTNETKEYSLSFDLGKKSAHGILIRTVLNSPQSLQINNDTRELGLALVEISISH